MATTPDETVPVPSKTITPPQQTSRTNGATFISIPTASGLSSIYLINLNIFSSFFS
jgi:hypothetical protein